MYYSVASGLKNLQTSPKLYLLQELGAMVLIQDLAADRDLRIYAS